jgi:uncharacterized membrane protein
MTASGFVLITLGLLLAGWGPLILSLYGVHIFPQTSPLTEEGQTLWAGASFSRLFGGALLGLGAVSFFARYLEAPQARRTITPGLMIATAAMTLMAAAQQVIVWQTPTGWITVAGFALLTGGYAVFGLPRRG